MGKTRTSKSNGEVPFDEVKNKILVYAKIVFLTRIDKSCGGGGESLLYAKCAWIFWLKCKHALRFQHSGIIGAQQFGYKPQIFRLKN